MTTKEKYRQSFKQALRLALPIVTGQLGVILMGFFDTVQIGGLGSVYIAAGGVSNSVYFLFILLGMGTLFISPLVSEAMGEQNGWKAVGVFRSGFTVAAVVSVISYLIIYFVTAHFEKLHETAHVTELSQRFLHVLNYSTPMLMFFTLGKQFMDGLGRTKVAMIITLVGLVFNITLNWILIYGHLGCPALGIEGAAIATGTARTIMCIVILIYILRDKQVRELYRQFKASNVTGKSYVPQILKIGVPSGLQMFFEVGAFSASQIMSGWLGETSLAASQVALNLASITFMMASGLAAAGTIMTGFAFGAKNKEQVKISGNTIYLFALVSQSLFALIFLLLRRQLPQLYTSDTQVVTIASTLLILAALFQLSDGFQVVGVSILRGIQDVKLPSVLAFASYWLIMVPTGYLAAFHYHLGVEGLWIGFVVGLSVAAILMYARFRYQLKHLEFTEL